MATSCAENSVVEVFEGSLDELYSSSVDSPSTCTTKTSHCSSTSPTQNTVDPSKMGNADSPSSDEPPRHQSSRQPCNRSVGIECSGKSMTRRSSKNTSLRTIILRSSSRNSSKPCSNMQTDDSRSNLTSCSSSCSSVGVQLNSQLSQVSSNALQYAIQSDKGDDKPKDLIVCQWYQCCKEVNFGELLDHLNNDHVKTQQKKKPGKEKPTYACKWVGCKVYEKPSTVHSWLERHVVCHLGNKPFRCIVDHCGMRFSSQFMLNRHINGHFPKQKSTRSKKTNVANAGVKKVRKERRKKIRHIRPCPAITRDFFDSFTMSCIQRYITNFSKRTQVHSNNSGQYITFHGSVIGRRTDLSGTKSCLIRWLPLHILPDEWMPEPQVPSKLTQVLPLSSLSGDIIKFLMCDW